jgi:UDP-2,4-diacetamido-2,4,6-trideoxy-beta-L-altropyranose hydrolase
MKAIFRADASPSIGGGHIMRCLVLADALVAQGWHCLFAVREGSIETVPKLSTSGHEVVVLEGPEQEEFKEIKTRVGHCNWLIVDHYGRDKQFEFPARSFAHKILVIDDRADRKHDCDLLLDQNIGRKAEDYAGFVKDGVLLLLGPEYALLRPEFSALRPNALGRRKKSIALNRVLLSFGASDPRALIVKALKAIQISGLEIAVDVATGSIKYEEIGLADTAAQMTQEITFHNFDTSMAGLMLNADLVIGAVGSMVWELCCLGVPALVIMVNDNPKVGMELERAGAIRFLGSWRDIDEAVLAEELVTLTAKKEQWRVMTDAAAKICDGQGAQRVVAQCERIS